MTQTIHPSPMRKQPKPARPLADHHPKMNKKQAEQQQRRAHHTQQHAPLTAADKLSNRSTSSPLITPSVPALLYPPKMPEPAKEIHAVDLLKGNKVHSPTLPPPLAKKPRAPNQQPTTTAPPSHGNAQNLTTAKSVAIIEAQQQQIANQTQLIANQTQLLEIADRPIEEYERRLSLMEKARVISETRFADQVQLEQCNETIIANLRTKEDGREVMEALRMGYAMQRERIRELEVRAGGGVWEVRMLMSAEEVGGRRLDREWRASAQCK